MLGIKDMRYKKVDPLVFLLKALDLVRTKTNYDSFSITINFTRDREVAGIGYSALPPEVFAELESDKPPKYTDFVEYTHGGGVLLDDCGIIPFNKEMVTFLNDLILMLVNNPATHRKKDVNGRWVEDKGDKSNVLG